MLNVDSDRYVTVDKNGLNSANDSISSVLGLLTGMQKIGERYFLFGEMRGDLLNTTNYTPADIRSLSDFTVSDTSAYANPRDYYAIINNCNYFISRTSDSISPLKDENAVAHAIRAWTYMQVAFNWGKVYYITDPLLSVEDAEKDYPIYDISQTVDALIADLEPYAEALYPNYGDVYGIQSQLLFIPVKVLLGDLYLWRGSSTADYEKAATYYSEYIDRDLNTSAPILQPSLWWSYNNFLLQNFDKSIPSDTWYNVISATSSNWELISAIEMAQTPDQGITYRLPYEYKYYAMSNVITTLWDSQNYLLHYVSGALSTDYYTLGDLRKAGNIMGYGQPQYFINDGTNSYPILEKFSYFNIMLYRYSLILLRYAEAVNRAGKPNTAFAVLKYGLDPVTLADSTRIPKAELADAPYITVFDKQRYTNPNNTKGTGIHMHGCGDSAFDRYYVLGGVDAAPPATFSDTIQWVENAICDELALETSFEGNRFQDLMRIAMRRNDPSFLAKHIAAKHDTDYARVYNLLMDEKNWFLPEKK